MKRIVSLGFTLILVSLIVLANSACMPKDFEYKTVLFSRDDVGYFENGIEIEINELASEGWSYKGGVCDNGANAQYVLFEREKNKTKPLSKEYKITLFSRDDVGYIENKIETAINALTSENYAYLGGICENGINARYILFAK